MSGDDQSGPGIALRRAIAEIRPAAGDDSPLSEEELRAAERLAGRVHAELSGLLRGAPSTARSASGLARYLGMERTVCQRMVGALHRNEPDVSLLTRLPGVRSLGAIVQRAEDAGIDGEVCRSAAAAVELLVEFFYRAGGSQAAFARRLSARPGPVRASGTEKESDGAALARAARRIVGRWSDVQLQTAVYRPHPERSGEMQTGRMRGFIGHRAEADAAPLVMLNRKATVAGARPDRGEYQSLSGEGGPELLFAAAPFCTEPVARATTRRGDGRMVQIIDPPGECGESGYDFVSADRSASSLPLPTVESPPVHEVWTSIDYPAAALLFDVWQHRDLARACIPSLSAHLYRINVIETVGERWYTRLAGGPKLQLLGSGLENAPSEVWPRQADALSWLFDRLGWDPSEFVGYRCEVRVPLWRIGYLMSFDFGGDAS